MSLFILFLLSGGIIVQSVEAVGAVFAEILLIFRSFFRVFCQIPLQLCSAMLIPPLLECTLQIPHLSFVWVGHGDILNLNFAGKGSKLTVWRGS